MRSTAVTGLDGPVGRRLLATAGASLRPVDARRPLAGVLDGVGTVVHLAWEPSEPRGPAGQAEANVALTRRLLDAADLAGVGRIVHLSSALVYGAWPDNPVPLTEEAALRPNPGLDEAAGRAEAERVLADWAADHPGVRVAVLRAGTIVGPGVDSWLGRAMAGAGGVVAETGTPARQFVHVDDVAAAVAFAAEQELDGVYNVAPDGSVRPDEVRSLVASRPRLPVPDRFGATAANLAWGLHLSDVSPEVLPLLAHPWVIANDRLRAAGWEPRYTSEEAVIAGRPGSRWREMSPGRRQEVTLAVAGAGIAAAVGGIAAGVIRFSRRR